MANFFARILGNNNNNTANNSSTAAQHQQSKRQRRRSSPTATTTTSTNALTTAKHVERRTSRASLHSVSALLFGAFSGQQQSPQACDSSSGKVLLRKQAVRFSRELHATATLASASVLSKGCELEELLDALFLPSSRRVLWRFCYSSFGRLLLLLLLLLCYSRHKRT